MELVPAAGCKKCIHSEAGKMERENAQRENATRQRVLVVNSLQRVPAAGSRSGKTQHARRVFCCEQLSG
jgi:hypothetical protein